MDNPESKNIDYQRGTVSAVDLHDAVRHANTTFIRETVARLGLLSW